jgi:hypothetical protein
MATTPPEAAARPQPHDVASLIADGDYGVYQAALERGQITFHHVAGAWFHLCDTELGHEQRRKFEALFPALLDGFSEPRGGIVTSYFCRNIRVAAALTDIQQAAELPEAIPAAAPPDEPSGRWSRVRKRVRAACRVPLKAPRASSSAIHIEPTFGDPDDWQAKRILFACLDLHYRALEFLTPKPRKICMRLAFGVITSLLGTLDSRRAPGATPVPFASDPAELECLDRELARAERYYARSAQRTAQLEYFTGILTIGLPVLILAIAGLTFVTGADPLRDPMLVSLVAGGVGAVVSVMNRMTSGSLVLVAESGKAIIRLLGAIRPLIGAVLALALHVLLSAELVSFATSPDEGQQVLVAAGLGFIAGFSERFAQDMIAGAAGGQTSAPATAAVQPEPAAMAVRGLGARA